MDKQKMKIGYKVGGSFEDYCEDGSVGFEILFPYTYPSYEKAAFEACCAVLLDHANKQRQANNMWH